MLQVSLLALPLLLGLAFPAAAQEPTPAPTPSPTPEEQQKMIEEAEREGRVRAREEVVVTGSLIPREDLTALSPVAVVDVEEVTYQGTGRVEDLIQQLPQAFAAQNSTISNGATGTATVALRNLGAVRTLSLLNGRRMAQGDVFATSADLNFVPSALISRVDILTGGAGSAYGADAVTGVVNFVLDTEFDGFRGEVQWNGFQHNNDNEVARRINEARGFEVPQGSAFDHGGFNLNLALGGAFGEGKGHAMAFVDYRDVAAITKDARDYTNCSVQTPGATGPACGGSATWQHGRFLVPVSNPATGVTAGDFVLDPDTGNTNTFRPRRATDVYNFAPHNFMQRNDEKWSGGAFMRYRHNEKVEPYLEAMVMHDYSDAQIAPSGSFFSTSEINCDNPMLSEQQRRAICGSQTTGYAPLLIGRRNVEGGGRNSQLQHTNWRLVAGMRGDLSDRWSYDLFGLNAQVDSPNSYENDFLIDRIADALDVVGEPGRPDTWRCRSGNAGCAPWNIFTIGGVSQESLDYMQLAYLYNSGTSTRMLGGTVTGDLGAKFPSATENVDVAIGAETRREALFFRPDIINTVGGAAGQGGASPPVEGNYNIHEAFAELRVPLVQDRSGAQDLALELGYRFANYKPVEQESQNLNSWKAMASWAPVDGFRLRGGFNHAVRAPNVYELFQPQSIGLGGSEDICAGPTPTATREQCANTGVTASQYGNILENPAGQYNSQDGGNPALSAETADTLTVGFVWTPRSVSGLSITADYYDIEITDTIDDFNPDDVVKKCAEEGDPDLCALIHRDALGTLWLTPQGFTESTNQNIGLRATRGVDVSVVYPWTIGSHGVITFSALGSAMLEDLLDNPLVNYDCVGFMGNQCGIPSPKWRHRMRASWNTNFKTTLTLGWRFISSVENDDFSDDPDLANEGLRERLALNESDKIPSFNWFDLAGIYRFNDKARITLGVNNIFDKEPPLGSGLSDIDFGPGFYGTYDPLGRAIYANLQFGF
jgi:outer membrane receptor protein involved in Fe transport